MPTIDWLKKEFSYGYQSGDILAPQPDEVRRSEEARCGADYRKIFLEGVSPLLAEGSRVLELGPGKGSWTRALLQHPSRCTVQTVDFQDVTEWLQPDRWEGRLRCHQVGDASFSCIEPGSVDLFFSFGVLCHNNRENIASILRNVLSRMRPGGMALHQHGDWTKLERFGWDKGGVPREFRDKPDEEIWWPRNDGKSMVAMAREAGWEVVSEDLGLIERDGMILLRAPGGSRDSEDPQASVREGMGELEKGNPLRALAIARGILVGGRSVLNAHMLEAAALLRLGREEEGIAALRKEVEKFPANKSAQDALGDLVGVPGNGKSESVMGNPAPVMVNLGCGRRFGAGWRNLDVVPSDPSVERFDVRGSLPFADGSVDVVYHSHLLEHLAVEEASRFLAECRRILKPGGVIRIAVPDLEGICRQYLAELDAAKNGDKDAEVRKDWMVLEMLDQVARHRSGGEMLRWWAKDPVPQEEFIVRRNGDEAREAIASLKGRPQGGGIGSEDPMDVGRFRLSGEVHRHMYDRLSLAKALKNAGFSAPRVVGCTESAIPGFAGFLLDNDESGRPRKPDSLFMEATR